MTCLVSELALQLLVLSVVDRAFTYCIHKCERCGIPTGGCPEAATSLGPFR